MCGEGDYFCIHSHVLLVNNGWTSSDASILSSSCSRRGVSHVLKTLTGIKWLPKMDGKCVFRIDPGRGRARISRERFGTSQEYERPSRGYYKNTHTHRHLVF